MSDDLQQRIHDAIANPKNLGEMENADSVGTVGSPDCGDMLRMWVKFKEDAQGRRVIDRATFQTFGCETAIAVASVATELIAGKTVRAVLEAAGVKDILSKSLGSNNAANVVKATLQGLLRLRLRETIYQGRGIEIKKVAAPEPPQAAPAAA
jgi:nitrogen fixation NifU-like protein